MWFPWTVKAVGVVVWWCGGVVERCGVVEVLASSSLWLGCECARLCTSSWVIDHDYATPVFQHKSD